MPSTWQQQSFHQPAATDKPFSIDGLCSIVFATFRNSDANILCITAGPNQQKKRGVRQDRGKTQDRIGDEYAQNATRTAINQIGFAL
jgi:hypothetical protein